MDLIVSNGLVFAGDHPQLNPEIAIWEEPLAAYWKQWFHSADKVPLAWYAALSGASPTELLVNQCSALPEGTVQCWVVSPYHAQLARDSVRVFPEGLLDWTVEDAQYLCATLNPLLADEGMAMHCVGAALLLSCQQVMQASPAGFGAISGHLLPNRHHEGEDGGRLNRLLSEIQMTLFQHPNVVRQQRGAMDVNGIWLWAPLAYSMQQSIEPGSQSLAVATRNPVLRSFAEAANARVMITEAERMHELLKPNTPLPKRIVLAGESYAVLLTTSWLPKFGKQTWRPKAVKRESALLSTLYQLQT